MSMPLADLGAIAKRDWRNIEENKREVVRGNQSRRKGANQAAYGGAAAYGGYVFGGRAGPILAARNNRTVTDFGRQLGKKPSAGTRLSAIRSGLVAGARGRPLSSAVMYGGLAATGVGIGRNRAGKRRSDRAEKEITRRRRLRALKEKKAS